VLDGDAIFVPDEIPRRGVLALWGTGSGTGKVELVFARGASALRKRLVTARFLSVAEALPELLSIDPNATGPAGQAVRPALGVWAAAATAGVGLVARGRLLPTVGPGGTDAWRIGPLDAADLAWLRELAAHFPAAAHALGHLETFTRRVAVPVERYKDAEATARFATLVRPFLLRRRKSDPGIAPELPPKTETDRIVPLSAEQVTLYEAVVRETMEAIAAKDGIERAGLVFKLLTALKQICNHPAQYLKQTGPLAGRSGKLAAFDELLDVILAGGESMLVFTQYTQMAKLLQQHLDARGIGSLFLHGGVPVRRREELVDEFQAGRAPVFLLSLKAGGTGLTLTRATHVLHYDRWWNPAVEDQATDRAYRIGQDRPFRCTG